MSLQYDREVEYLKREYAKGRLTLNEFNHEMYELDRSFNAALTEQAEDAYNRVMDSGW